MTVIFGGITLMLSDDFYIRLKAAILNLVLQAHSWFHLGLVKTVNHSFNAYLTRF